MQEELKCHEHCESKVKDTTPKLKALEARIIACNGDCGSKIGLIINQCVNGTVKCYIALYLTTFTSHSKEGYYFHSHKQIQIR